MLQRLLTLELAQWIRKHCTQTLFLMLFIKPQSFTLLGKKRNWLSKINQRYIGMGRKLQWLSVAQSCPTRWVPMDYSPPGSSIHGIFPGKNTGVGSHSLLQGILPTQGSNPGLLHCKQILYHLSQQASEIISRSVVSHSATPWTVACQFLLSMGFPRQEY